jgi:hypothetical protein
VGGHVLVPAFAIGRTQTLLYHLSTLVEQRRIPDLPIAIDTPLGLKVTDLYEHSRSLFDRETLARIAGRRVPARGAWALDGLAPRDGSSRARARRDARGAVRTRRPTRTAALAPRGAGCAARGAEPRRAGVADRVCGLGAESARGGGRALVSRNWLPRPADFVTVRTEGATFSAWALRTPPRRLTR